MKNFLRHVETWALGLAITALVLAVLAIGGWAFSSVYQDPTLWPVVAFFALSIAAALPGTLLVKRYAEFRYWLKRGGLPWFAVFPWALRFEHSKAGKEARRLLLGSFLLIGVAPAILVCGAYWLGLQEGYPEVALIVLYPLLWFYLLGIGASLVGYAIRMARKVWAYSTRDTWTRLAEGSVEEWGELVVRAPLGVVAQVFTAAWSLATLVVTLFAFVAASSVGGLRILPVVLFIGVCFGELLLAGHWLVNALRAGADVKLALMHAPKWVEGLSEREPPLWRWYALTVSVLLLSTAGFVISAL